MSLKTGPEHLGVSPEMARIMRAALLEQYFHPPSTVGVYDPHDSEKKQLLAAWRGDRPLRGETSHA